MLAKGKYVTPFIAMVTLLAVVGYPHLVFAEACNTELAQDMRVQCHQNVEINDSVGASVYCTEAGKQVGICAAELTGKGHYVDLVIKVKLLYSARLANLLLHDQEAADNLEEAIVDGAHEVLRSSYARSDDRTAMKTLLSHMSL
jgi:hypothetical protein